LTALWEFLLVQARKHGGQSGCRSVPDQIQDLACKMLKIQELTRKMLKIQDLACKMLKIQELADKVLNYQDFVTHHMITHCCISRRITHQIGGPLSGFFLC